MSRQCFFLCNLNLIVHLIVIKNILVEKIGGHNQIINLLIYIYIYFTDAFIQSKLQMRAFNIFSGHFNKFTMWILDLHLKSFLFNLLTFGY